jgi:hypothetical protein
MPASLAGWLSKFKGFLVARLLSAFIEAHEHAQRKIHAFLGLGEEGQVESSSCDSFGSCPEEVVVLEESKQAVSRIAALWTRSRCSPSPMADAGCCR